MSEPVISLRTLAAILHIIESTGKDLHEDAWRPYLTDEQYKAYIQYRDRYKGDAHE